MNYFTIVTDMGLAALAAAAQAGEKVAIANMAMGDGGGTEYEPNSSQTALVNEKWRGGISSYTKNGSSFTVAAAMPAETDAFTIRELALFLSDGTCFAVANAPSIPHQPPVDGAGTEFEAIMPFILENADSVIISVDPSGAISQDMIGQPGGVAGLGEDGKIPAAQLPEMDYAASEHTHAAADITSGILALARGGTGAGTAQGARTNLEVAKPVRAEVSFPASGWALSSGVYTQTVSCAAAAETMHYANIGPKYSTDAAARELEQEAYALIAYVDTADGSLTATCWGDEKPEVNLTLIFEGGLA